MAYRLDRSLDTADAVRAAAVEQLDDALGQLREGDDRVKAIHEARKDFKKVRSLLRLARPKGRRKINGRLRDIAAELAGARDADVMVATVDALRERFAGQLPARAFTTVRNRLARQRGAELDATEGLLARIDAEREGVAAWRLREPDLVAGVGRAYARGRSDFKAARKRPTVEGLHEWRKRVKDLWYHARLLEEAWPPVFAAIAEEAHTLSDLLGDDHDLGVLAERLAEQEWPPSVDGPALIALCHRRRAELEADAFVLGAKLYAEKPDAFARRIGAYLT